MVRFSQGCCLSYRPRLLQRKPNHSLNLPLVCIPLHWLQLSEHQWSTHSRSEKCLRPSRRVKLCIDWTAIPISSSPWDGLTVLISLAAQGLVEKHAYLLISIISLVWRVNWLNMALGWLISSCLRFSFIDCWGQVSGRERGRAKDAI